MKWAIPERSKIRRLPKFLWPAAVWARQLLHVPRFQVDGLSTTHITSFTETPRFQRAYARAVKAGRMDFNIPFRVHQALWCSRVAQRVKGDFVELGTGRGFIMSALLEDGLARPLHLFDTFLSSWPDQSGKQSGEACPYYADSFEETKANFAEWSNVHFHPGDVCETLPKAGLSSVSFAHIDMNHPDPEEFGVRFLWPLMPSGAVILFDDYAYANAWSQHRRINQLAEELGFDILTTPGGQGIVIKS